MKKFNAPTTLGSGHSYLDKLCLAFLMLLKLSSTNAQTVSQYSFAQSTGTYTAISGGTVLWTGTYDDNTPATVTIPSFDFAGTFYTTMYVSPNGFLTFGSAPATNEYNPISSAATYSGCVSAFGCDIDNSNVGSPVIRWQQVGSEVVVQWTDARRQSVSSERISFQIRLNTSTGAINIVYGGTIAPQSSTSNYPLVGLRGLNNTFATNVNNRRVDQTSGSGSTWATSAAGTTNADECRFNNQQAGRAPVVGQTYTWTPPCLPPTVSNAGADQTICTTSPTATMAANTAVVGTGAWSQVSGTAATITTPSSPSTTITGLNTAGARTFRWTISNSPCTASTDDVIITVNAPPTTANAGADQTICSTSGSATMAANTATTGTGAWSQISGPSTATITTASSATTTITAMTSVGAYTFRWTISNAPCTATTDDVVITTAPGTTAANAGADQNICVSTATATMAGNTAVNGTGVWSQVSGPSTATIVTAGSPTTVINALSSVGTYVFQWTITNAPCATSSDQISVIVKGIPTTANAGADQTICSTSGSATMAGNTATTGAGAWSQISGPSTATITTASSATTTITAMTSVGAYTFRWTISNAPCTATTDDVVITTAPGTTAANAGADQNICVSTATATMAGNTAVNGTGVWSQVSGPSTATIVTAGSPTTVINALSSVGTYVFQWTITNAPCATSSDQISVIVKGIPTTANAGADQTICSTSGSATMAANTATTGTGAWSQISGPSTATITTASSATTTITAMTSVGAYTFRWTISNAPCTATTDDVVITTAPGTTAANAGADQTICNSSGATLAANSPTNGTGAWSVISGPSLVAAQFNSTSANGAVFSPAGGAGTYTLRWTISNAPCSATTDDVVITVNPQPTAPTMTPTSATICNGGSTGLSASSPNISTSTANGSTITITDFIVNSTSPYPGTISVSGLPTSGVTVTNVKLNGVSHNAPLDLDILLKSPLGTNVVLLSDVGTSAAISSKDYVIQDGATAFSTSAVNASGTYAPTNSGATDNFPSPGPGSVTQASPAISGFSGNMNGTWSLYVVDDNTNFLAGSVSSWSITFSVPVSYAWSPSTGLNATNVASVTASPTSTTTYTATVTNPFNSCTNSNTVVVTVNTPANAGTNGSITLCSNGSAVNLFNSLGGSPQSGGTWTPSGLTGGSLGTFTPGTSTATTYTYTVTGTAPCANASATVNVSVNNATTWYQDSDGDGSGDPAVSQLACAQPSGYVSNNNDGCPADANKIAPGQCGCGVADTDSDGDGTANCNDGCPNDANKIAPGVCGCGVADTDSDGDGTANCNDGCPNDPNKIAPGICGCGVSDVDTDGDATVDCNDGCPNDANKTAPGICGCGLSDVDTDSDGAADCNDGCPNDANKIAPGQCGCGVADTDSDGDGTANCNDGCPNDANKIAPGVCGCGVSDVDSDSDGTADCYDDCPSDPNKLVPGQCGCGVADTDDDGDGTANCNDGCPNDPDKIAPGICGCGVSDVDSDGDATVDCLDGCPTDPNKIAPGICGCGVSDVDTDGDGAADCYDECPDDPNKIATGECGCGVVDVDTDGDLTPDCNDNCPNDPNKINPGACGCGVVDMDSDGDGYMDCLDGCPNDPNKIAPGACGCGQADVDSDGDGTLNCLDGCPNDPNKIAPGACGCGNPEPGASCNDGNTNTINDVIGANCTCAGTSVTPSTTLELTTDNNGVQTSWAILPYGGGSPVCGGSGYANNTTVTVNCVLPDGCYTLRVMDSYGDGMCCMNGLGGYVLRDPNGKRIIDAAGTGIFSSTAEVSQGFCLPLGNDHLTSSRCDREDYLPSDFVQATPNPAVQAQFGVNNANSGYQFWFFKPNGGYSRRVLMTHANAYYVFPGGPDRCSYFQLDNLTTDPLPHDVLLNVRVRSMVNGVYSEFGPACRFKIDLTNQCPTTQLINDQSSPHNSCGLTNVLLDGSRTLYVTPVSGANKYQFEFSNANYLRKISVTGSTLNLTQWATLPLQYGGISYNVRVRVSFDNGASYCAFGPGCTITTAGQHPANDNREMVAAPTDNTDLSLWPNPNHGDAMHIVIEGFDDPTTQVRMHVLDLFGKEVYMKDITVEGDELNTIIDFSQSLAEGVYIVNISASGRTWTRRLVIE